MRVVSVAVTQELLKEIRNPASRDKENGPATDNAISSVAKILAHQPQCVDAAELMPEWISWLPCSADEEEALTVHRSLCTFIERYE